MEKNNQNPGTDKPSTLSEVPLPSYVVDDPILGLVLLTQLLVGN